MAIKGARPDPGRVTPHLVVRNADEAMRFYKAAFGAVELYRSPLPNGQGTHVHFRIANSMLMLTEEDRNPEQQAKLATVLASPQTLGGTTTVFELDVPDADATVERAVKAGGKATLPLMDAFWGDRYGWVTDPFGYIWAIATVREELTPEEVKQRMDAMFAQMSHCGS